MRKADKPQVLLGAAEHHEWLIDLIEHLEGSSIVAESQRAVRAALEDMSVATPPYALVVFDEHLPIATVQELLTADSHEVEMEINPEETVFHLCVHIRRTLGISSERQVLRFFVTKNFCFFKKSSHVLSP